MRAPLSLLTVNEVASRPSYTSMYLNCASFFQLPAMRHCKLNAQTCLSGCPTMHREREWLTVAARPRHAAVPPPACRIPSHWSAPANELEVR